MKGSKRVALPLTRPVRVRLELKAAPLAGGDTVRFASDKKLTALRVLLHERFGEPGVELFENWALFIAKDQHDAEVARTWGGPDAAA